MDLMVSVIVPVYKAEKYLDRCVQSIVEQTYKNLEIILVDDGSPDNCPAMCDAWAEKDSRVQVIHKENGGVSSARNAGLDLMNGSFVMFVDSDDSLDPDAIASLCYLVDEYHAEVSACGFKYVGENGSIENESTICGDGMIISDNCTLHFVQLFKYFYQLCYCWNRLYTRAFFEGNNPIRFSTDLSMAEDLLFNIQVLKCCNTFVMDSKKHTYNYLQNSDSITHGSTNGGKNWVDNVKSHEIIFRLIEDENIESWAASVFLQNIMYSVGNLIVDEQVFQESLDEVIAISKEHKKALYKGCRRLSGYTKCKALLYLCSPKLYCRMLKTSRLHQLKF